MGLITNQELHENTLLLFTAELLLAASRAGVHWHLLVPASSLVWRTPLIYDVWRRGEMLTHSVKFDWCRHGRPWLQTSRILGTAAWPLRLGRRCRGGHEHDRLWGTVASPSGTFSRAEMAAAPSRSFCVAVMSLAAAADPRYLVARYGLRELGEASHPGPTGPGPCADRGRHKSHAAAI